MCSNEGYNKQEESGGRPSHSKMFVIGLMIFLMGSTALAQDAPLPKEVCGYKVQQKQIELKDVKLSEKEKAERVDDLLVTMGRAQLVSATPVGVTFDVPVVLSPVTHQGEVKRLVFENFRVNDNPVTIEDYEHKFKLPNREPLTLTPPLRVFVSTPQAVLSVLDEFLNSKDTWPVTGRVYVCGEYKKFIFKFKRAVPVEMDTEINNPLR